MKRAHVLGSNGQCGSYLVDILIEKGYEVHGMIRKDILSDIASNLYHITSNPAIYGKTFFLCKGDLADPVSMKRIISETRPDEIYNEAGVDHVSGDADFSDYAADITGAAVGRLLEMILQINPNTNNHRATMVWAGQNINQNSREFPMVTNYIVGPFELQTLYTEGA